MAKFRRYTDTERQIALLFYERIRQKLADDADGEAEAFRQAAKFGNVEEAALRFWATGASENDPVLVLDSSGADWEPPEEMPEPPEHLTSIIRWPEAFAPAYDLQRWMVHHFVSGVGALTNDEHVHLRAANIALEWTNIENAKAMRGIIATAELPGGNGSKWAKGRELYRLQQEWGDHWEELPGALPDFLITVDAVWWAMNDAASRCATLDHELYHCFYKIKNGAPVLDNRGMPLWAMRGHDIEEFVGVRRRWGAKAAGTTELEACPTLPEIAYARVVAACGTCAR